MDWRQIENPPELGVEVVGFSPTWICEDFNPKGTRVCFRTEDGWTSARWVDHQDCYTEDTETKPTHWLEIPLPFYFKSRRAGII